VLQPRQRVRQYLQCHKWLRHVLDYATAAQWLHMQASRDCRLQIAGRHHTRHPCCMRRS
jgi:hypothetical protein